MKKIRLTYFTPTYNRSSLLPKLYDSLKSQTNKNFIWLIIDDGSTDNTKEIIKKWIDEKMINIEYVYKENGGKHTAIDLSNKICKTEYITCVDSDDYLTENATDVIYRYINNNKCEDICGFVGRRADYDGKPNSENWPQGNTPIFFNYLYGKYKYKGETVLVFKTDIIKHYSFPSIPDERFITESVFYNQFMYKYKMAVMQECIYLSEYQSDGYTSQGANLFYKNPKGYLYALRQNAYCSIKYKGYSFKYKLYYSAKYYAWRRKFNLSKNIALEYKIKFPYNLFGRILSFLIKL